MDTPVNFLRGRTRADAAPGAAPFDRAVPGALLRWYDEHARDLPWRRTSDPYAIMVSEFMLQQTQVKTVIPYYHSFLDRFPSFAALAEAPVEAVLEAWKGLGYYRRARNLHAAAKAVVERYGGEAPREWDAFRGLPGVGDYTAAAVLSIAFGKPYPAVDGNVIRVGARLLDASEAADSMRLRRRIAAGLSAIIPHDRPGDFNQAMMELGATLCLPHTPECGPCPLATMCLAKAAGRAAALPLPARRTAAREERYFVVVPRLGHSTLLAQRPDEGLLAGLWEFPRLPADAFSPGELSSAGVLSDGARLGRVLAGALAGDILAGGDFAGGSLAIRDVRHLGTVDHRFSHLIWRLDVLRAEVEPAGPSRTPDPFPAAGAFRAAEPTGPLRWVPDAAVERMALSKAMQKAWELVRAYEQGRPTRPT